MISRTAPRFPPGVALVVAVLAISWAAPLVRFTVAPALVISAWRLVFSTAMVGGLLAATSPSEPAPRLHRSDWALAALAGACLGGHFWAWVAAVQTTTVASASVLVSLQPVFVAVLSILFLRERPMRREWAGIGLAVLGAAVVGWGDLALGGQALLGDALALLGGLLMAIYLVVGRSLRQRLDLWRYVGLVYGTAAILLVALVVVLPGVRLTGYEPRDWAVFLAMAAGPMMLGHTGMNYAVKYVSAYLVNLAALAEPVGATLIAWLLPAIGEVPTGRTILGGVAILAGIAVGLSRSVKPDADPGRRAE